MTERGITLKSTQSQHPGPPVHIVIRHGCGHERHHDVPSGGLFSTDLSSPQLNVCSNECWDRLFGERAV